MIATWATSASPVPPSVLPVMSGLLGRPPVTPDRETAQRWAVEELAGREYAEAEPGLLARGIRWLYDHFPDLPQGPGSRLVLVGLLAVVLVAVLYAVARVGVGRSAGRAAAGGLFGEAPRTAAEYRAAADRHAAAGEFTDAVVERFRAVARELEERAVLVAQPGRTADELAGEAGQLLPALAGQLAAGSSLFDDVRYGGRTGTPDADRQLRALDEAVRSARPAAPAATMPVVDRGPR